MLVRSWPAKEAIFDVVDSKSKSKPSTTAVPNGRFTLLEACTGPNMAHTLSAAATASAAVVKPPSVYVSPPTDSMIVLPYVDWQS